MSAGSGRSQPPDDDELEAELRNAAATLDPVPPWLERAAADVFDLRQIDAELAQIVFDSALERSVVRGDQEPRLLTFQAGDVTIEIELSGSGSRRRLVGHLVSGGSALLELRSPRGTVAIPVDGLGRFAAPLAEGPFSLACRWPPDAPARVVVTDWV